MRRTPPIAAPVPPAGGKRRSAGACGRPPSRPRARARIALEDRRRRELAGLHPHAGHVDGASARGASRSIPRPRCAAPASGGRPTSRPPCAISPWLPLEISIAVTPSGTACSQPQPAQDALGWLMEKSAPRPVAARTRSAIRASPGRTRKSTRSRQPPRPHTLAWPPGVVTSSPTMRSRPSVGWRLELVGGVVVIGDGDEVEAGLARLPRDLGDGEVAVAVHGVDVEGAAVPARARGERLRRALRQGGWALGTGFGRRSRP